MASPFRVFRKYMKTLMVVFGVLIMFSFVLLDPLAKFLAGDRPVGGDDGRIDANAVAASWDGGDLTNREVNNLVMRRQVTNGFLEQVEMLGAQSAYMAGIEPPELRVQRLIGPDNPQQGVEQSVVRTKLFADAAREAGMHVSDESLVRYLDELGRGRVTRDDMRAILERLEGRGMRVSIDYVLDALRDEMLARNYFTTNIYAFQTVTPQQRWKDWLSVNERVIVEAAAVPVEASLVDVKEPTEAELQEFFDQYKNREASPELVGDLELPSARPGFREPREIDAQYLQANFAELVAKAEAEITDEEIAKFYEENKELFIKADTGLLDDATDAIESQPEGEGTDEGAATEDSATPPASESDTPADPATESPAETPADGQSGENGAETPPEQPESEAPPTVPAAESAPTTPDADAGPADSDQSNSSSAQRSVFRQVAFLQESDDDATAETDATEAPAADAPATEGTEPATPGAESEGAAPGTEADASPPAATADPAASAESDGASAVTTDSAATPAAPEAPKEYQPLEEVRDIIRRDLAQRRVAETMTKQMEEVLGELAGSFNVYFGEVLEAQSQNEKAPAPPAELADLQPIAEKHGLTYGKTGPLPWLEFRNTPVGKSGNPETGMPLSSTMFGSKDLELYQPVMTIDIDGNQYISMKTSDQPGRVPDLKEVRDEVVRAWKMQKAAEIALKDAEDRAKKAQEAGSPLTDYFADDQKIEVVRTDPFSQLTRGDVPDQFGRQRFRLSQPDGLKAPGPEFMRKVFELEDGEVTAVLNNDHTIAYVVRMVEHVKPIDELRTLYLAEANTWDGLPTLAAERASIAQRVVAADISGGKGVDWKRTPDQTDEMDAAEADEAGEESAGEPQT